MALLVGPVESSRFFEGFYHSAKRIQELKQDVPATGIAPSHATSLPVDRDGKPINTGVSGAE
jgi:hypothetical protein